MDKKTNSFFRQAAILAAASLVARFLGFFFRIILTGHLGDEGNGIYSESYNIYMFLLVLSSAGFPAVISKMVSERIAYKDYKNAHNIFQTALKVAFIAGIISALIMWIGAPYLAHSRSYYAILTLAPTTFIVAIMSVYRGYFQGMGNFIPTAVSQIVEQIFHVVASLWLASVLVTESLELGAAGATAGTGVGAFFGLVTVWIIYCMAKGRIYKRLQKNKKSKIERQPLVAKEILKTAIPIIAGMAVFSITNIIDTNMVMSLLVRSGYYTDSQVYDLFGQLSGKYVVLVTLPVSISTAMAAAVIPNIAASFKTNDMIAVRNKINFSIKLAMLISIPAAVGIGVLGDQILLLLFPSYPGGSILLKVGSVSIVFLALCQILTGILQGTSHINVPLIAAICGAIVKIIINAILIPIQEINVLGAVISTIACYLVAALINMFMMYKKIGAVPDFMGTFIKPIISSFIMGITCYAVYASFYIIVPDNTICLAISIFISIIAYFGFLYLIGGIDNDIIRSLPFGRRILKLISEPEE